MILYSDEKKNRKSNCRTPLNTLKKRHKCNKHIKRKNFRIEWKHSRIKQKLPASNENIPASNQKIPVSNQKIPASNENLPVLKIVENFHTKSSYDFWIFFQIFDSDFVYVFLFENLFTTDLFINCASWYFVSYFLRTKTCRLIKNKFESNLFVSFSNFSIIYITYSKSTIFLNNFINLFYI